MFRISLRLAATASVLALAAPAFAQDAAPQDGDEILVTAQRNNQTEVSRGGSVGVLGDKAAEDVPFSIKSYGSALILNQQPQTLGQVLENDPSIRTSYGFGNASEQFVIRGFTLYGDDIGMNGLYGIAPRQLVAPELYESVQVLNGASAFLNGAAPGGSGLGGSVNLELKRAGAADLNRATVGYTSGSHFGGSFDVSRRFGSDSQWGVRVNGAFRSGDVSIDNEFRETAVAGGAIDYQGTSVRLSLDLAYQRVKIRNLRPKVTIGTTVIPRVPRADQNYGQRFSYSTMRDVFGIVKGEWDVADNAMLYASFGARDGSEQGIYDGVTVLNATTGAANGNDLYVPRTDNNEAATVGMRVKLGSTITHEFNFGGSYNWLVNRNAFDFLYGPGFAGYATNIYNTPAATLPASAFVGGDLKNPYPISRTRLGSMFASDTIGLFGDRLLVTGGLRLQKIKVISYSTAGGAQTGVYNESAVTPVIGLVVKPGNGFSLFANRIEGLVQGDTAPIDPLLSNSGEVLAPFKTVQYEIGGKIALGRFNASIAAYQIDRPTAYAVADPARPGFSRFGTNGEQRNKGIELSLDGELTKGLRVIAGASVNDAKLRRSAGAVNQGNKAVGVPEYTANANVEWDVANTGFTLTGRVVHTGKQMVNLTNTLEIPEWTRFDLGARYVAVLGATPLTLRVNVDNVANKRYWASAFDVFNASLLQGAPRTFKASASIDF